MFEVISNPFEEMTQGVVTSGLGYISLVGVSPTIMRQQHQHLIEQFRDLQTHD